MKASTVRWCMNETCSLVGQECLEDVCTRCGEKPGRLRWTLIVCQPQGIYMGLVSWPKGLPSVITAYQVRSCVWYRGTGSLGLATVGPSASCRITGAVDEMKIQHPKTLAAITPEALAAWKEEPWSGQ